MIRRRQPIQSVLAERKMFANGGLVGQSPLGAMPGGFGSSNPLGGYRDYLNQTYAVPEIEGFVKSVRAAEQEQFGGGQAAYQGGLSGPGFSGGLLPQAPIAAPAISPVSPVAAPQAAPAISPVSTPRVPMDTLMGAPMPMAPPGAPPGFIPPPGGLGTTMVVPYVNPSTGETWDAPLGGYTPPEGWQAVLGPLATADDLHAGSSMATGPMPMAPPGYATPGSTPTPGYATPGSMPTPGYASMDVESQAAYEADQELHANFASHAAASEAQAMADYVRRVGFDIKPEGASDQDWQTYLGAKASAQKRRDEGFMGREVLPGEGGYASGSWRPSNRLSGNLLMGTEPLNRPASAAPPPPPLTAALNPLSGQLTPAPTNPAYDIRPENVPDQDWQEYLDARAGAQKRRDEGFMGRVILPGERDFDYWKPSQGAKLLAGSDMPGFEAMRNPMQQSQGIMGAPRTQPPQSVLAERKMFATGGSVGQGSDPNQLYGPISHGYGDNRMMTYAELVAAYGQKVVDQGIISGAMGENTYLPWYGTPPQEDEPPPQGGEPPPQGGEPPPQGGEPPPQLKGESPRLKGESPRLKGESPRLKRMSPRRPPMSRRSRPPHTASTRCRPPMSPSHTAATRCHGQPWRPTASTRCRGQPWRPTASTRCHGQPSTRRPCSNHKASWHPRSL